MAITNGYCTLADFVSDKRITSQDIADDAVIEDIITDASRLIDAVCDRRFYARTETRYFDIPYEVAPRFAGLDSFTRDMMKGGGLTGARMLKFDEDLISITTFTNGDGTTIASTEYDLLEYNTPNKYALALKSSSSVAWQLTSAGNSARALSIVGSWGYVNRAASDATSVERVRNTHSAALLIAVWDYLRRMGREQEVTQIVGGGIIVTPAGEMPKAAYARLTPYMRRGMA